MRAIGVKSILGIPKRLESDVRRKLPSALFLCGFIVVIVFGRRALCERDGLLKRAAARHGLGKVSKIPMRLFCWECARRELVAHVV